MSTNPRVSVIIIFYQAERFIAEAIQSVCNQTLVDWELILIDDGSTDASSSIAFGFAKADPHRIRVFAHAEHANRGMAASRNLGMAKARGKYLSFLDADDTYHPDRLLVAVQTLESQETAAVVITSELYWRSWSPVTPPRYVSQRDNVIETGVPEGVVIAPPRLLSMLTARGRAQMPGICSVTFNRLDADGLEGAPESFTGLYEDQCIIAILLASRPAIVIDKCLARYRIHPNSSTAQAALRGEIGSRRRGSAEHRFLEWLEEYLRKRKVADLDLWKAVNRRMFPYSHPRVAWLVELRERAWMVSRATLVRIVRALVKDHRFDFLRRVRERVRRRRIMRELRRELSDNSFFASLPGLPQTAQDGASCNQDGRRFALADQTGSLAALAGNDSRTSSRAAS